MDVYPEQTLLPIDRTKNALTNLDHPAIYHSHICNFRNVVTITGDTDIEGVIFFDTKSRI